MKTSENSYEKQANDFLTKIGASYKAKFIKNDLYFSDDKETRDIFTCSFKRNNFRTSSSKYARFSIRFGQSINESTGNGNKPPRAYDVLAAIQKYEVGSFENFCSEFGYDLDSRKAYKTYLAVCKEYDKVSKFFTSEELEEAQEIN
jgi:hypothetical protein